jgi:hypothetical protein
MKIYEIETRNGRVFRVATENANQEKRLSEIVNKNKQKSYYEVFTRVEVVKNGIHTIKQFEKLSDTLI